MGTSDYSDEFKRDAVNQDDAPILDDLLQRNAVAHVTEHRTQLAEVPLQFLER